MIGELLAAAAVLALTVLLAACSVAACWLAKRQKRIDDLRLIRERDDILEAWNEGEP